MMKTLMEQDDGARRMDVISLEGREQSPANAMTTLGSTSFQEPLRRNAAETHLVHDQRTERRRTGLVPWSTERHVPDVGGVGWRTKAGHMLKNQAFYPQRPKTNLWDNPTFAGVNTWKEYHGPRLRADAAMMERLDLYDEDRDEWEARKTFVNTKRAETLDRFHSRKLERSQLSTSSSWAPPRRPRREICSKHETFDGALDEKPPRGLRKVFTESVLSKDRDAIRQIAGRIQNEETWKQVFKQMEQERRADLRADLQQRQAHTDRLMLLSGQPVKQHLPPGQAHRSLMNSSVRTDALAKPRLASIPKNICQHTDFRGLVHAEDGVALEALLPGAGLELSTEFKARASASTQPGWPPPPAAETPRRPCGRAPREAAQKKASMRN